LDIFKKNCAPLRKLIASLLSQAGYGPVSISGLSVAVGPRNKAPAVPPSHSPEPAIQTLSCELNLIETLQLCLFLKHSHTVALIYNFACHNSNKWTFIFNASTAASLSTQHYGAKPVP